MTAERLLPIILVGLGILYPTSISGNISPLLYVLHQLLFCTLVLWIGFTRRAFGSTVQLWNANFIVVWCVAATVLSPFTELAIPGVGVYVTMAFLFSLDLSRLEVQSVTPLLRGLTALVLVAAGGVMAGNSWVIQSLTANYSIAYPELVPTMLAVRKPVFTFGSHSLAGFFYFLLFYLNLETYRARRRGWDLMLAVGCVLAGALLTSISAAVLMSLAIVMLFLGSGRARWALFAALGLAIGITVWRYRSELADFVAISNMLTAIEFQGGGFSGRFGRGGNLLNNVELIRTQPLRPIGLGFSTTVFYGDSGPVEYLLRGSLPLLLSVYGGYALFLWRSLHVRRHALMLFAVTLAFELGMTVLTYHRFVYFLLFVVLYLNHLDSHRARGTDSAPSGSTVGGMTA